MEHSTGTIMFVLVLGMLALAGAIWKGGAAAHDERVMAETASRISRKSPAAAFGISTYRECGDSKQCEQHVRILASQGHDPAFTAAALGAVAEYRATVSASLWSTQQKAP